MTVWRLDIDECSIYCGDERIAILDTHMDNDGWRAALRIGEDIVRRANEQRVATMTIEQNMGATLRAETGFTVKPGDKFACYRESETP